MSRTDEELRATLDRISKERATMKPGEYPEEQPTPHMTKTQGLEVVAWTNDSALALLREHWPMVAVLPTSYEQTPLYPIPLVTLSAANAIITRLEEECRLSMQTIADERARAENAEAEHSFTLALLDQVAAKIEAAEAERDALRKALGLIDALDPEEHVQACSADALRGLVNKMGAEARQALEVSK